MKEAQHQRKKRKAELILSRCRIAAIDPPWWVLSVLGYKTKKGIK